MSAQAAVSWTHETLHESSLNPGPFFSLLPAWRLMRLLLRVVSWQHTLLFCSCSLEVALFSSWLCWWSLTISYVLLPMASIIQSVSASVSAVNSSILSTPSLDWTFSPSLPKAIKVQNFTLLNNNHQQWLRLAAADIQILARNESIDLILTFMEQCGTLEEILWLNHAYPTYAWQRGCHNEWAHSLIAAGWADRTCFPLIAFNWLAPQPRARWQTKSRLKQLKRQTIASGLLTYTW